MNSHKKPSFLVRRPNKDLRDREHLRPDEVDQLIKAAKKYNRYGLRDSIMIMLAYRHGLRRTELISLRWSHIDFKAGSIAINRLKGSVSNTHPLHRPELKGLRELFRDKKQDNYIFVNERSVPMSGPGFLRMLQRTAKHTDLTIKVHPHMLRHACGYKLANDGTDIRVIQSYLGHKDINNTVRYTELAPNQFESLWKD